VSPRSSVSLELVADMTKCKLQDTSVESLSPSLKSRCPSFDHLGWQKKIRYWRCPLLHCSMYRRWHTFKHE